MTTESKVTSIFSSTTRTDEKKNIKSYKKVKKNTNHIRSYKPSVNHDFDGYMYFCENCTSSYCRCNDIEEEAGFTIDHISNNEHTMNKYVCKICYKLPINCECL